VKSTSTSSAVTSILQVPSSPTILQPSPNPHAEDPSDSDSSFVLESSGEESETGGRLESIASSEAASMAGYAALPPPPPRTPRHVPNTGDHPPTTSPLPPSSPPPPPTVATTTATTTTTSPPPAPASTPAHTRGARAKTPLPSPPPPPPPSGPITTGATLRPRFAGSANIPKGVVPKGLVLVPPKGGPVPVPPSRSSSQGNAGSDASETL
jgi:hypothetical protein